MGSNDPPLLGAETAVPATILKGDAFGLVMAEAPFMGGENVAPWPGASPQLACVVVPKHAEVKNCTTKTE
jgi:hypothetical protein